MNRCRPIWKKLVCPISAVQRKACVQTECGAVGWWLLKLRKCGATQWPYGDIWWTFLKLCALFSNTTRVRRCPQCFVFWTFWTPDKTTWYPIKPVSDNEIVALLQERFGGSIPPPTATKKNSVGFHNHLK